MILQFGIQDTFQARPARWALPVALLLCAVICFGGIARAVRAEEAVEFNAALRKWGVSVRGSNLTFNPIYPADALIDGTPAPGLFGSNPDGLVGAEIVIDLPQETRLEAIVLTQSQRRGQFNRAKEIDVSVDGGKRTRLKLENLPGKAQRFPLKASGRLVRLLVVSQYDDPETNVGGFDEIELLTRDNLAERYAAPKGFQPLAEALIQPGWAPEDRGPFTALAGGAHPRTLWSQRVLAEALAAAKANPEAQTAIERHLARAAARMAGPLPPAPVVAETAAVEADHLDRAAEALELALGARLGGPSESLSRAARLLAAYSPADSGSNGELVEPAVWLRPVAMRSVWLMRMSLAYDLMQSRAPRRLGQQCRGALNQVAHEMLSGLGKLRGAESVIAAAAVMTAGAALDEDELFAAALHGRQEIPGLMRLVASLISEDGRWIESLATPEPLLVESLVLAAECAARRGEDLYGHAGGRLRLFLLSLPGMARPDGVLPPLTRQGEEPLAGLADPVQEVLSRRFGANRFGHFSDWRLPWRPLDGLRVMPWPLPRNDSANSTTGSDERRLTGGPVPLESAAVCLLPSSRIATAGVGGVESGTGGNWAAMRVGDCGTVQPDVLSIDMFLGGRSVLPFNGMRCSDELLSRDWYGRSLSHNTVVVDGRTAVSGQSDLELLASTGWVGMIRGHSVSAWPGAVVDRTVLLTRYYALDMVSAESGHEGTFDLFYHGLGRPALSLRTEAQVDPLIGGPGYELLRNLRTLSTGSAYRATWRSGSPPSVLTTYTAAPQAGEALLLVAEPPAVAQPRQVIIDRRSGKLANYATALEVNNPAQVRRVSWLEVSSGNDFEGDAINAAESGGERAGARAVSVQMLRGNDYVLLADRPGVYSAGGIVTDARAVWVSTQSAAQQRAADGGAGGAAGSAAVGVQHILMAGGRTLEAFEVSVALSEAAMIAIEFYAEDEFVVHHLAGPAAQLRLSRAEGPAVEAQLEPHRTVSISSSAIDRLATRAAARETESAAFRQAYVESRLESERQAEVLREAAAAQSQTIAPIVIEAERISSQQGGEVEITESKVGTRGNKSFLRWNDEGHTINYYFTVQEEGVYQIGLKYATREDRVRRRVEIDPGTPGVQTIDAELPTSGNWSNQRDDWLLSRLIDPATGQPWLVRLTKGRHQLRMRALNRSVNLDYIVIAPAGASMERSDFE